MTPASLSSLRLPSLDELKASLAKDSLPDFIRSAWPLVEPTTPLHWNWHLDVICSILTSITNGLERRVLFNVPPGTSKSLIISTFWPAWEWIKYPSFRYLTSSYSDDNTIRDNRRVRDIVTSDWYSKYYSLRLTSDQWAKIRFDTQQKGWRIATSVGGTATGEHPDRIIIDDPIKADDARSTIKLKNVTDWYDRTISTRVARDPAIVVIMQRLHMSDLSGHLLAKGGFKHVCFPMRFDPLRADPLDQRTEPGTLLWPSLWPEARVRQEELDLGPFGASGQLQQHPVPEGGGLFKRSYFPVVDAAPARARRCRGWDTAGTERAGDWTVGVKLAVDSDGTIYVEDVVRDQLEPGDVDALIKQTAQLDGKSCMQREEQEPGSSGKAVIVARSKMLAGYDYMGVQISGDKVVRARPFRSQAQAGNVRLVRGEWNHAYLDVVCSFPVGGHDDDVDATSCAYNSLVGEKENVPVKLTWGR